MGSTNHKLLSQINRNSLHGCKLSSSLWYGWPLWLLSLGAKKPSYM